MTVRRNTTWKFKDGRGDRFRRLRVLHAEQGDPHVEVRSFYLDEPVRRSAGGNSRRQPKTILMLQTTLLKDYECLTTHLREGPQESTGASEIAEIFSDA